MFNDEDAIVGEVGRRPTESVQINIPEPKPPERPVQKKPEENTSCVIEVVSSKFHCIMVARRGKYVINTSHGRIKGSIQKPISIVHEQTSVGFHVEYRKIPEVAYMPLQEVRVTSFNSNSVSFDMKLADVMLHLDNGSSILSSLRNNPTCSFTYRSIRGDVVASFYCTKFLLDEQGLRVLNYFGVTNSNVRGRSRNKHGVADKTMFSENGIRMFRNIKNAESIGWNVGNKMQRVKIESKTLKSGGEKPRFLFDKKPRRSLPYGIFSIQSAKKCLAYKPQEAKFLFTTGYETKEGILPFVSPVSGHQTFSMTIGTSVRRFNTFTKFMRTIGKWTKTCHGKTRFKMFYRNNSPEISISFHYDTTRSDRGKITIRYWDSMGVLMTSYTCPLQHLIDVFAKKALLSVESNAKNQKDWNERYFCPHENECPRNCAHFIPDLLEAGANSAPVDYKGMSRVPIPKDIPCQCVGDHNGFIPICSIFHYYIEIGKPLAMPLSSFFSDMLNDYNENPGMYKNSPIVKILNGSNDILFLIDEFLF